MIPLGKVSAILGIVGMAATGAIFTRPFFLSDAPPYASINRVDGLQALIVRGNILGARRSYCEAVKRGDFDLATSYDKSIDDLQIDYERLTTTQFPLRPCVLSPVR